MGTQGADMGIASRESQRYAPRAAGCDVDPDRNVNGPVAIVSTGPLTSPRAGSLLAGDERLDPAAALVVGQLHRRATS